MCNAMIIDSKDNVVVAIEAITRGETVRYSRSGKELSLIAREDITIYHKLAAQDIVRGEAVVKYGEHIGIASCDIKAGEHVHVHNVESRREKLG